MTRPNWRDGDGYKALMALDAPGFAWEFLKRNHAFVEELRFLKRVQQRRKLTRAERELFALRWGVRFCWAQRCSAGPPGDLDARRAALNHRYRPLRPGSH
jgi:hypothetical protein